MIADAYVMFGKKKNNLYFYNKNLSKMISIKNKGKTSEYVYDISLDGTVVNANGLNINRNTDGFNFKLPTNFRYTEENPYISEGLSRETEKGKKYTGFKADVAEFNDLFMSDKHYSNNAVNKMGLGIDEVVDATINFSRKNYADFFPENPFPEDVKMVGNTIKSKKMPEYISKFLEKGIRLLLRKKGQDFITEYYDYIDKIYNYHIPLKLIASKGKIKKSVSEYTKDCNTITKAGRPKSRQAWMELAIRNKLDVNMGDTIYYINIGKTKSQADVKKVTKYFKYINGEKTNCTTEIEKEWKKDNICGKLAEKEKKLSLHDYIKAMHPEIFIEEEIILNCEIVGNDIINSENDMFCEEGKEYNVPKYIEQFNKRITPLLVCFNPSIRDRILITNPSERQYFTEEECELCSGFPNKFGDQDTFEQLMTMDDKEIKFWLKHPEWKIPYIEECGMDWEKISSDYIKRTEEEKKLGITEIKEKFEKAIQSLTTEEFNNFEDGELPESLNKIVTMDLLNGTFMSKEYPDVVIGRFYDIYDAMNDAKFFKQLNEGEEEQSENAEELPWGF